MANAPYFTAEEKKRQKGLGRDTYTGIPSVDFVLGTNKKIANAAIGTAQAAGDRFMDYVNGPHGAAAQPAPAAPVHTGGTSTTRDALGDSVSPQVLKGAGLTRVVKTAPHSYTDAAGATGETRYYNQFGNRADVAPVQGNFSGPADYAAAEQANQYDLSNPAMAKQVLDNGRTAQDQFAARQQEVAQRQQLDFLNSLDPEDRAKLTTERIKESGLDRRAAATNALTARGQDITLRGQNGPIAQHAFENDLKLNDRLNNPETRDAEINRVLAPLQGLSRSERIRYLADPNNKDVQSVIAVLEQNARQQNTPILGFGGVGGDFNFGDLARTGHLQAIGGKTFSDQNTFAGGYIDPKGLSPYLTDQMVQDLIDARRVQSKRDR